MASVYERSREFARVHERWADWLKQNMLEYRDFAGVGVAMLVQVCSYERSLELYERKQAYEGVHERSRI